MRTSYTCGMRASSAFSVFVPSGRLGCRNILITTLTALGALPTLSRGVSSGVSSFWNSVQAPAVWCAPLARNLPVFIPQRVRAELRFPHSHRTTTTAALASPHKQTNKTTIALLATFLTYPQIPQRKHFIFGAPPDRGATLAATAGKADISLSTRDISVIH